MNEENVLTVSHFNRTGLAGPKVGDRGLVNYSKCELGCNILVKSRRRPTMAYWCIN